jgi:hypothetical protein
MLSAQYNTSKNTKNYANPTEDNPTGLKSYMNYTQAYKPADTPAFDMYGITKTGNVSNRFVPAPEMKKEELLGFSEFLANKEGFFPGYNSSKNCSDINPNNPKSLAACIADLSNNIFSIQSFSEKYKDQNQKISSNYANINSSIENINKDYAALANDTSSDAAFKVYTPVDKNGNFIISTQKKTKDDVALYDTKHSIIQWNGLYIVASMSAVSLLIAAIAMSRR